jgi:FemAB-related protein (PEP-CTERM system-associated)
MTIIECDDSHAARWDAYVAASPSSTFYHRWAWRAINKDELGHRTFSLAAMEGDAIVGVFPIVQVKTRLFGNILCSMPFVNYGGPSADSPAIEQALLAAAAGLKEREGADYLEVRSRQPLASPWPTSTHKVSLVIDLQPDPEILFKAFTTKHRQEIRRAYKNDFTTRFGGAELLDDFYAVLSESWHMHGTPLYQRAYFDRIVSTFGKDIRIGVVYHGADPAAVAFDGLHNGTVEGMWLGSKTQYRNRLVGYVLYWELIKNACETGFRRFHLGRSTAESTSESFKKKWNADALQLYWSYVLKAGQEVPELNVTSRKFQLAIMVWQETPAWIVGRIGPRIARGIP